VLPTVVGQMAAARGAEESTEWRQPVDLVALCDEAADQMAELVVQVPVGAAHEDATFAHYAAQVHPTFAH
jgi:hypothetical protein